MARHNFFRILKIGLDWFSPLGPLPLQSIWIDIEFPTHLVNPTRKGCYEGPNRISQNIKNRFFNSLLLDNLQGIVDGHHIKDNGGSCPNFGVFNQKKINPLIEKMIIGLIIRKAGNMVLNIGRKLRGAKLPQKIQKTAILSRKPTTSDNKNMLHMIPFLTIYSLSNYTIF